MSEEDDLESLNMYLLCSDRAVHSFILPGNDDIFPLGFVSDACQGKVSVGKCTLRSLCMVWHCGRIVTESQPLVAAGGMSEFVESPLQVRECLHFVLAVDTRGIFLVVSPKPAMYSDGRERTAGAEACVDECVQVRTLGKRWKHALQKVIRSDLKTPTDRRINKDSARIRSSRWQMHTEKRRGE